MLGIKNRIRALASVWKNYFQVFWGASSLITEDGRATFDIQEETQEKGED